MNDFLAGMRSTIVPGADERHGPLPLMLLGLSVLSGLVDAFSYLVLGHVFVANMTGNVIFLGFALVGSPGFSIGASLTALAAFFLGALLGGAAAARLGSHRGKLLRAGVVIQAGLLAVSLLLVALSGNPVSEGYRYALIVALAINMGLQNAVVRKLGVPDLTTTVLTLTITGTAADSTLVGGKGASAGRRVLSVLAIFLGALCGALLVIHSQIALPLAIALAILLAIGIAVHRASAARSEWINP